MEVRIDVQPDHVHVAVKGEFDAAVARDGIARIVAACRASGLDRVLIDGRSIDSTVSVMHRYELALALADNSAPVHLRMAIVVSHDNMFAKTLEQSAMKMGMDVRTTESMAEGLIFLGLPVWSAGPP
jgi:hypothetical protein